MTLKSTGFKLFAKIMGGNYVFYCSSRISFNPTSHLKHILGVFFSVIFLKTHPISSSNLATKAKSSGSKLWLTILHILLEL